MESALIRLKENVHDLTKMEKIAAEYILNNLAEMTTISIHALLE